MTVNMVESVPTKWGERERERGEKGGCRECLDFREIEECYLNITANTYIFVRRKRPLEINWIFTWQYEPLSVFVWYSNPKIQPNIKITKKDLFEINLKQTTTQAWQYHSLESKILSMIQQTIFSFFLESHVCDSEKKIHHC